MADIEQAKFVLSVKPNAKQNQVIGFKEGKVQLRIAASPVDGKANLAIIRFLSECLGVSKSSVIIEKGLTGKTKTVLVRGLSQAKANQLLQDFG